MEKKENWFSKDKNFIPVGGDYLDVNRRLVLNNRILIFILPILTTLLIVCLFTILYMFLNRQTAIMLPPYDTFHVSKTSADKTYFQVWGEWFITQVANVSDSEVEDQINLILVRFFDRNSLIKNKIKLEQYVNAIRTNKISQNFRFKTQNTQVLINDAGTKAKVSVFGVAEQIINDKLKIDKKCSYDIVLAFSKSTIFIIDFSSNCFDNKKQNELKKTDEQLNSEIYNMKNTDNPSKILENNVIKKENIKSLQSPDETKESNIQKLNHLKDEDISIKIPNDDVNQKNIDNSQNEEFLNEN